MPNHVQNKITLTGNNDQLAEIAAKLNEHGFTFEDFVPMPKTLNIPAGGITDDALYLYLTELNGTEVSDIPTLFLPVIDKNGFAGIWDPTTKQIKPDAQTAWEKRVSSAQEYYDKLNDGNDDTIPTADAMLEDTASKKAFMKLGETVYHNILTYRAKDWYDWCCENWGTKWDAYEVDVDIDLECDDPYITINFQTAWGSPFPIFESILKQYPGVSLRGCWADENIGSNCGEIVTANGKIAAHEPTDLDEAIRLACYVWGWDPDEYFNGDEDEED